MWLALLETALLFGLILWGGAELWSAEREASFRRPYRVLEGVLVDGESVKGVDAQTLGALLQARATEWLDAPLRLKSATETFECSPRELGVHSEVEPALQQAFALGREGDLGARLVARLNARRFGAPIVAKTRIDGPRIHEEVAAMAKAAERPPSSGQMDLQLRKLRPAAPARGLLQKESRVALLDGLARRQREITLASYELQMPDAEDLHDVPSIAARMGESTTRCLTELSAEEEARWSAWIDKLNGQILEPELRWSLGKRLDEAREGDATAGARDPKPGGCDLSQIASTIAAAAFFSGLDLVERKLYPQLPRFIEPGLESWVAWPDRDLVLQNPHPDPVVLHLSRRGDRLQAEFLGSRRPFRTTFERSVQNKAAFAVQQKKDAQLLLGSTKVLEAGQLGYTGTIARVLTWEKGEAKRESWTMEYPAKTQVEAVGTNPLGISAHADSANQGSSQDLPPDLPPLDLLLKKVQ